MVTTTNARLHPVTIAARARFATEICIDRDMYDRCNSAQLTSTGERFLCVASPSLYVWHVHDQLVFGESDTIVIFNAENQHIRECEYFFLGFHGSQERLTQLWLRGCTLKLRGGWGSAC